MRNERSFSLTRNQTNDHSILISTYNWAEVLNLGLQSVLRQTVLPDEILADDGSITVAKALITSFQSPVPIKHVWHEDKGFRKAMILNKAVAQAEADYIIQVVGDCILHKNFVEGHVNRAKKKVFLHGTRANVKEELTKRMIEEGGYISIIFLL